VSIEAAICLYRHDCMRLSKLHINGFKSFPDRAELGFDHGVTAIVGPNGCGKSNVVDAITWVLGEQSAKSLRGERMEDVIFNGSDARKPTAAAEVRLRLSDVARAAMATSVAVEPDDPDPADEGPLVTRNVEIGRRLYRSGESEYLIDGEVCRLRDVHDFLMDSGLGVKAYAVIEQGKIGQILSSRPAERRMLIEEAAGVTKYKSRRRAAELKLEAARQNLTRIDDIIFEVEKQRSALRRQAARARRYKRLREELRRWEQVQFARRHERLSKEIDQAEQALAAARALEAAAAAHVAELDAALEAVRLELTEGEAAATETRERAHARELAIGRRQQQVDFDKQQIEELARQAAAFESEAADLEGRRGPARLAIEAHQVVATKARRALGESRQAVDARESAYGRASAAVQEAEREADHTRAAVLSAASTLAAFRQARDHADAVRARVAADREKLDFEFRELERELARATEERIAAGTARVNAHAALEEVREARAAADREVAAQRTARDQAAETLLKRQRDQAGAEARLTSLEELDASRATFGDAARFLLAAGHEAPRRHGAVADHLDVERSFERAVDALLGDLLQHVIVDRAEDVGRALSLVADARAGRCGLVVLDGASGDAGGELATPIPDVRTLRSVVRPTGPHAQVLKALVGDAWIVDSPEAARALARTAPVPVATRMGDVWRGAHRVEGGARAERRGILETRGEVATLRELVASGAADLERVARNVSALDQTIRTAEALAATHATAAHDHEKTIVGLEAEAARVETELVRLGQRHAVVTTERRQATEAEAEAGERRDEASRTIDSHETEQRGAEGKLASVLASLQAARDGAETAMRAASEARADQTALTERTAILDAEATRLEDAARDLDERMAARRQDVAGTVTRRQALAADIHETERLLDADVHELDRLRADVRRVDDRLLERRGAFTASEQEIRAARHVLDAARAEAARFEVAHATAASDLAHLAAACLEALNLAIDDVAAAVARMEDAGELVAPARRLAAVAASDAAEEAAEAAEDGAAGPTAALDEPAMPAADAFEEVLGPEQIIADLKQKIDRLGPVNMMAIEQFDDLEARHTFLTTQRKDLLDSIAQTGEAIRRIDKTTRERFDEAFVSINTEFQTTFSTLFGGGRAGLVLIDQENESESGVDMIAQPPGKRLQNVQLLSGGEKALTAMALMFAIFKYRPSPFCLLDEIDAPLDDANIGRFVEMLQGMQSHTQFILITHNRKTMEIANRLYGVTMEEPGVSKLISLELQ
jgi:chromosome segregation protein